MGYKEHALRNVLSAVNNISPRDDAQRGQRWKITFDAVAALAGVKRGCWRHMGVVSLWKFICHAFINLKV